ncbi:LacI family DNA-binding transcriptional regulator [Paratractidigestivibacter sp.]|uniref:LacI family DNA-binding transcriptional regulator n=1 Tax=Paratractidigestivibacter sp. TaxID=2847316 RepID=UPI002ABE935C|nr:LacI family DNA-binding transcriptional regulator [Paratractidigestivibacter sp.]
MATISDVAKLSGLSVATVSRVINNKPHVSAEKRERVQAAMDKLGYAPLQAARQMRGSGSGNIAVAIPTITNNFFAQLVDAIEKTCRKAGYRSLITQTQGEKSGELDAMNLLKMQHADGLILCSIENKWDLICSYAQYGALAVCDEYNASDAVSQVLGRQYDGFFGATQYLIGCGYRRIAYCTGFSDLKPLPKGSDLDSDRYTGYVDALKSRGLAPNPAWRFEGVSTLEDGRNVLRRILAMAERPDAVVAGSDEVAVGLELEAMRCRLKVPDDIAIIGVDDQPIAEVAPVPLTTIRQPIREMGTLVAQDIVHQLSDEPSEPVRQTLNLELIVRSST